MTTLLKTSEKENTLNSAPHLCLKSNTHYFYLPIYLEDTDAGGIVYHANYLKFSERARTNFLRFLKISQNKLMGDPIYPSMFVVQTCSASFFKPAFLDDLIEVRTQVKEVKGARISLVQEIFRQNVLIVQLHLTLAYVKKSGMPIRLPPTILKAFKDFLKADF